MSEDQLQPQDTLEDHGVDDVLDEGYSPPEHETDHLKHPQGGETLDERLAEEEPEVWAEAEQESRSDIVDGDVSGEVGEPGPPRPDASAEEAAMHTTEDDPV
ncbi:MAG: hypothetical protein ABIN79_08320 [Marmoricola sp.]